MFKRLFSPGNDSFLTSLALLFLRVWLGVTMLVNHGVPKLKGFSSQAPDFADPFKIGHTTSFTLVVFAEVVCSILLMMGFTTRFAALVLGFNMAVAFLYAHKASLSGGHSGELAFIYLAGYVALFLAGGGTLSMDKSTFQGGGKSKSSSSSKKQ